MRDKLERMPLSFRCPENLGHQAQGRRRQQWLPFFRNRPPPPLSPSHDSWICSAGDYLAGAHWLRIGHTTTPRPWIYPFTVMICFIVHLLRRYLKRRYRRTPNYDNDFHGLCKAIKKNEKTLTSVVITKNSKQVDYTKLAECLEQNTQVESIDLFLLSSSSAATYERLFKYILASSSLQRIALTGDSSFAKQGSNEVTDLFLAFASTNPAIRSVELTDLSVSVEALSDLLSSRTAKLEHILLQNLTIMSTRSDPSSNGPEKLASAFLFNNTLRSIDFRGRVQSTSSSSSSSSLSRQYWVAILQKLQFHAALEKLHVGLEEADNIRSAKDVTEVIRDIVDSPLLPNLRMLSMSGFHFDVMSLETLSECLVVGDDRRLCKIQEFRLQNCHFDADATLRFELIIQANSSIKKLSLGPDVDFDGGLVLSTMLHENQTLQELDLERLNPDLVSPTEYQLLWKHLENMDRKLQRVSHGTITDPFVCQSLVHSLPLFSSLRSLTVGLDDKLCVLKSDLLSALEKNSSLYETNIHATFWSNRDRQRIQNYTERNRKHSQVF